MAKLQQLEIDIVAKTTSGASKGVNNLATALENLAKAADGLGEKAIGLTKVAAALGRLAEATKNIGDAPANIRKLGTALKHIIADTQGVDGIADGLEKVATAIANIAVAGSGIAEIGSGLRDITNAARNASSDTGIPEGGTGIVPSSEADTETAEAIEEVGTAAELSADKLQSLREAFLQAWLAAEVDGNIDATTESLQELNRVLNETTWDDVSNAFDKLEEAIAKGDAGEIATAIHDVQSAMEHLPPAVEEATEDVYGFKEAIRDIGGGALSTLKLIGSAYDKIGRAALAAGKAMVNAGWERIKSKVTGVTKALGGIWSSFKRIAMYRALRTIIKEITQGFSEGIKHVYQWAQLTGDSFVQTMDSMATSAHYLRDSLGAMASPLLDAIAPAIEIVVEKFVSLLNVVNQFISTLTGKDTWRKAVRTSTSYGDAMKQAADSTKAATKAQKELNKTLAGFDELNLLTTNDINARKPKASSGKDSGVSEGEFVEVPVADWIKQIKDAIENGDWAGAGKLLATKLNEIVSNFDAEKWGEKLGKKIQNGLKFYNSFMENMDWSNLGLKASTFINSILGEIDPEDLGHAITAKIKAGLKFLSSFAWNLDLSSLGTALGVAFNDLFSTDTMEDLGLTISGFINDAIEFGSAWIDEADLESAGYNIIDGLVTAITSIDWGDAGTFLADVATGLIDFLLGALESAIDNIDEIMTAVVEFVDAFFTRLGDYFHEKFFGWADEVNEWFGEVFGTSDGPSLSPNSLVGDFEEPIQGAKELKSALDELDGTTASVGAKDKDGSLASTDSKAKTLTKDLDKTKGTRKAKFTLDGAEASKTKVNNYLKKLNSVKGTYNAVVNLTGYKTSLKEITTLQKSLDKLSDGKYKMVVDVVGGGTSDAKVVVNNYMGTGLTAYAEGGWPSEGSMFVAGEAGPEIVSTINGKTGVASTKEVTGIATAVYETGADEAALLREQNRILRQIANKKSQVTLAPNVAAGKWISQAQTAYARATGG